jgi:hypothetical protein
MQDPDRRGRRARCAALIQGCRVDHAINGHLVPATDANGDAFTYTLAKPVKIESPAVCWQPQGFGCLPEQRLIVAAGARSFNVVD